MFWPTPLVILITLFGNLLVDCLAFSVTMRALNIPAWREIFWKAWWRVWRNGFPADLLGAAWLAIGLFGGSLLSEHFNNSPWLYDFTLGMTINSFRNPMAFLWTAIGVAFSGICIYFFNHRTLKRHAGLDERQRRRICLILAVTTAPWTFFIPVGS